MTGRLRGKSKEYYDYDNATKSFFFANFENKFDLRLYISIYIYIKREKNRNAESNGKNERVGYIKVEKQSERES